jgi:hypothetical protein
VRCGAVRTSGVDPTTHGGRPVGGRVADYAERCVVHDVLAGVSTDQPKKPSRRLSSSAAATTRGPSSSRCSGESRKEGPDTLTAAVT